VKITAPDICYKHVIKENKMNRNVSVMTVVLFALICNTGCFQKNPVDTIEDESKPALYACSTAALATVPPYVDIEMDESAFYFFDMGNSKVCKIDKNSGAMKSLKIQSSENLGSLCMDNDYLYAWGWNRYSVYRINKSLNSSPELLVTFDRTFYKLKAGDNCLYVNFKGVAGSMPNNFKGLFVYDIQKKTQVKIHDQNTWFDTDKDNLYWISIDTVSNERTLLKMPHHSSKPDVLAKGKLWYGKMMDEYIYCWDDDDNLLRVSKHSGSIESILSSPVGFTEDNGYVILDDIFYVTDNYDATLSGIQIKNPQKGFLTIAKKGRCDDDDMNSWLWTDKEALYWVAGPDEGTSISDEQWGTLFKTCVNKDSLFTDF
jgi:hypothetical protein